MSISRLVTLLGTLLESMAGKRPLSQSILTLLIVPFHPSTAFHVTILCIACLATGRGIITGGRAFREVTTLVTVFFIPANFDCRN
jgi:hypothetical protein